MANGNGNMGKILFVDLVTNQITEESVDEDVYKKFLGGYGLGAKVLYERMQLGVDPLGPDNILGFAVGPLTGTGAISSGRFTVLAKSPLTGLWGDANCGGTFGPQMKRAGYDAIFISGKSEKPVYLLIDDGKAEIRDASHLWGKDGCEAERTLKAELSEKIAVACIGQSGEKLSLISCVLTDMGRAAGRSGLGAVMGSKNLKAVVVNGKQAIQVADRNEINRLNKTIKQGIDKKPPRLVKMIFNLMMPLLPFLASRKVPFSVSPELVADQFTTYGTCGGTAASAAMQDSPIKNWGGRQKDFPMATAKNVSDDAVISHQKVKYGCFGCPVKCGGIMEQKKGPYAMKEESHKPEYETLASFGSLCLNNNLESILLANDLCNRYGLDTISAGVTIAFAIECYEEGILTKEDTGIELGWGNHEGIIALLRLICEREGFGDILADGVKVAADRIGRGSERFAMHVGGQELPMHDPRRTPGYAATYVIDPTPARHVAGGAADDDIGMQTTMIDLPKVDKNDYTRKGEMHVPNSNLRQLVNCAGICYFPTLMMKKYPLFGLLNAATGWNLSIDEWMKTGERIQMLRYCFNIREGFNPNSYRLPSRVRGDIPFSYGPLKNVKLDDEAMAKSCLRQMGIDDITGKPLPEKLKELELTDLIGM